MALALLALLAFLQAVHALSTLNSSIKTHKFPAGLELASSYDVQVKQSSSPLYTVESYGTIVSEANTTSGKGIEHNTSFALFDFSGSVDAFVTYKKAPVQSAIVRPHSYDIQPTITGNMITFTLNRPRIVVLQVNDDIFDTLQLFTNAVETDVPVPHDPDILYFGPGIDNGSSDGNGTLAMPSDNPETMDGVVIRNVDILDHHEPQLWYQGCIAINPGDSDFIRTIQIEDVRVENFRLGQLLNFRVMYNSKYNTSPGRGTRNVYVKGLVYNGSHANPSLLLGYDQLRNISNVTFANLRVNEKLIHGEMAKPSWYYTFDFVPMFANEYVNGLNFTSGQ
ncbi:putative endo-polygalacturonase [Aspergillus alliaceus]|uniref:putative endo-polygalacturonase n=1 Tax=Petromyces alliaceus TaxID=209559 RepID=UPI0012A5A520|nr:uncharacterized protein BDW43DRAFT_301637 [Aspergillus alliaceus]KAB8231712.1 hypothetical protein BDW43DRAFT_301637 [Aspergillus alliaceus]